VDNPCERAENPRRRAQAPGATQRPLAHPPEPAYPCCLPALGGFSGITPHEGSAKKNSPCATVRPTAHARPPRPRIGWRSTLARPVSLPTEDSPSGLGRTLGKRVGGNPSRVQISYPPLTGQAPTSANADRGLLLCGTKFARPGRGLQFGLRWCLARTQAEASSMGRSIEARSVLNERGLLTAAGMHMNVQHRASRFDPSTHRPVGRVSLTSDAITTDDGSALSDGTAPGAAVGSRRSARNVVADLREYPEDAMTTAEGAGASAEVLPEFAEVIDRYAEKFTLEDGARHIIWQLLATGTAEVSRVVGSERDRAVAVAAERLDRVVAEAVSELNHAGITRVDSETLTTLMLVRCPLPPFCTLEDPPIGAGVGAPTLGSVDVDTERDRDMAGA
jgi:hypothetical protein